MRLHSTPVSFFFLFQWNPSFRVDDKKLKRRQLPPCVLMCSRNNSSQSRPELQSVLGVPARQNPCSSVLYKVSRAANVCGNSSFCHMYDWSGEKFWTFLPEILEFSKQQRALCCVIVYLNSNAGCWMFLVREMRSTDEINKIIYSKSANKAALNIYFVTESLSFQSAGKFVCFLRCCHCEVKSYQTQLLIVKEDLWVDKSWPCTSVFVCWKQCVSEWCMCENEKETTW